MKHFFSLPVILAAFFIATLSLNSCKENTLIDSKISPADNVIGVFDTTLSCITHTYYDDTTITSLYIPNFAVLQGVGSMTDPFFGSLTGNTHFQLLPTNANIALYKDKTIDSAVLVLPYSGYTYGDTSDQSLTQSYQAFLMNEGLVAQSVYFSFTTKLIDEVTPLSDPVNVNLYHLQDSVSVAGKNYNPGLRIPLKLPVLLNRLMPALTLASNNPNPNAAFHEIFRGVSVRVADSRLSTKAYPFFRLDGTTDYSGAGIIVYYHTTAAPTDTLHERYFFNGENCGYFNGVKRTYSHAPVNMLLNSVQANDSVIALQNLPGPCIDIVIPGISSLPVGLISKAEIRFTLLPGYTNDKFSPVDRLYPIRISNGIYPAGSSSGTKGLVLDWTPQSSREAILDGRLHDMTVDGVAVKTYTIGIPRELMALRAAKSDTLHLHISGTERFYGAFRMVVGGGNHPNPIYKAKLFVVYSSLN